LRALIAHELGHVYGLDDNYLHDVCAECSPCNDSGVPSVMDGIHQGQACDTFVPTSRDIALVFEVYGLYSVQQGVRVYAGPDAGIFFEDSNIGEYSYRVVLWRWDSLNLNWYNTNQTWEYFSNHAIFGPNGSGVGHTFWFRKPTSQLEGLFALCITPKSARWASPPNVCAQTFLFNNVSYDGDNDGFSNRAEEGIPACLDSVNQDTADSESAVNDGCPAWGGKREVASECADSSGADSGGDPGETAVMVNDGCPKVPGTADGFSEADIRIGTNNGRRCAATTTLNDEPIDSHPPDFNDDRRVDLSDVSLLGGASYNKVAGHPDYRPRFDLNASGAVDISDFSLMSPYYNQPVCTP
jgi:hypothetical protein